MQMSELPWKRRFYLFTAIALAAFFFWFSMQFLVPAHQGVDQNGYLVGGRMLAEHGTMAYRPVNINTGKVDPFLFVGRMWVGTGLGTPEETYYPKYPLGFPALVAVVLKLAGVPRGMDLAYWINPVSMSLAVLAVFFLVRMLTTSFMGFLASAVMAASPLVLGLTTNPNSHATAVCCVAWGMFLLLRWWQADGFWRAAGAGFLLGYAATIRYTEGTLILPMLLVAIMKWLGRRKASQPAVPPSCSKEDVVAQLDAPLRGAATVHEANSPVVAVARRATLRNLCANVGQFLTERSLRLLPSLILLTAWALPVGILLIHNVMLFGSLTGYDLTNESEGFAWSYFLDNWETMFLQIDTTGLSFFFPFAVAGLVAMFWRQWRLGLVMALWLLPCALIYTFYYWAPAGLGYARFFLTIVPALIMCAFWGILRFAAGEPGSQPIEGANAPHQRDWPLASVVAGLLAVCTVLLSLRTGATELTSDYIKRTALHDDVTDFMELAKPGSVVVCQDNNILHHLQFVGNYQLYGSESFERPKIQRMSGVEPDAPQGLQPQRQQALYNRLKDMTQPQLTAELRKIMTNALDRGQGVFFIKREEKLKPPPLDNKIKAVAKQNEPANLLELFSPDQLKPPQQEKPTPLLPKSVVPPDVFDTKLVFVWLAPTQFEKKDAEKKPRGIKLTPAQKKADQKTVSWLVVQVTRKKAR